tara:strand:- start:19 stop:267 length:249 start_codon:yes stop_codon:yes gene_type:complete
VIKKELNIQLILESDMEIKNDNDRRLWFRIKSIDKKIDSLGKIGSEDFDWLKWEGLTDESARLYSQLSVMNNIVEKLKRKWS